METMRCVFPGLVLVVLAAGCAASSGRIPDVCLEGAADPELDLPVGLEPGPGWYRERIRAAERITRRWFERAGHPLDPTPLIQRAIVRESLEALRPELARACGPLPADLPATFSGTVCGAELLLISREAFRKNFTALYSGQTWRPVEFQRLVTHEMAHQAHARIARRLFGSEEGMGPRWFFEGLAIACAGQFPGPPTDRCDDGLERPMDWPAFRKRAAEDVHKVLSYPVYGHMFRWLASKVKPGELIRLAGKPDFLRTLAGVGTEEGQTR